MANGCLSKVGPGGPIDGVHVHDSASVSTIRRPIRRPIWRRFGEFGYDRHCRGEAVSCNSGLSGEPGAAEGGQGKFG